MTIIFNFWRWIILCSFPLDHRSFMKGKSDRLADVQKGCCVPAWTLTARSSANRNVSSCSPYALLASPPIQHPPLAVQMYYKLFCLSPYLMARFPFFPHVAVRSHINTIWSLIFSQLFFFFWHSHIFLLFEPPPVTFVSVGCLFCHTFFIFISYAGPVMLLSNFRAGYKSL